MNTQKPPIRPTTMLGAALRAALESPAAVRYLVHCPGRASLWRTDTSLPAAQAKAKELAAQFPGHEFTVWQSVSAHEAGKASNAPQHFKAAQ